VRASFFILIVGMVVGLALTAWRLSAAQDALDEARGGDTESSAIGPIAQAEQTAAMALAQQAAAAAEAYAAQQGTYAGLTSETLRFVDPAIDASVVVASAGDAGYCVQATYGGATAHATGPALAESGPCS
jgi:hypothetical protein